MDTAWRDRDRFERRRFDRVLVPLGVVLVLAGGLLTAAFFALGRPSTLQPGGLALLIGVVVLVYGLRWRRRRQDHERRSAPSRPIGVGHHDS